MQPEHCDLHAENTVYYSMKLNNMQLLIRTNIHNDSALKQGNIAAPAYTGCGCRSQQPDTYLY